MDYESIHLPKGLPPESFYTPVDGTSRLDRHTLTAALAKITADQRQIVLMRVVQGLGIHETAKAVGKSEDSVKQLQSRGLKALKRVLDDQSRLVSLDTYVTLALSNAMPPRRYKRRTARAKAS
jgi:DNA-directed RNA polymerase specialized sigma24 family protein